MSPPDSHGSKSAGGTIPPPRDARVGSTLADRYRLDALLGEGGMGKVYAAEHVLMRKKLAVKILHRELTAVPEVVARFEREAMAAANIDHPNVAAATDFGKLSDGSVFLVLEFVQGRNLRDEIAQGPMTVERALLIGRQIGMALAAAHALNIVHRDLKPENVMLVQKGNDADFVKVLDFGIAKVPIGEHSDAHGGKPITKVGMVFGTPEYMAPEQALGQSVDGRADVYALGVIVYEMIAGVRPFSSKSAVGILGQQLSKPPPTVVERCPGLFVPPAVDHLLQKLLAREAAERFQTANDAVAAIDALLGPVHSSGQRLFTMAAGSPPSSPSNPRIASVPDLEPPVPVLMPPDISARIQSAPGVVVPSASDPAMSSSPSIDIRQSFGSLPGVPSQTDPYEVDLEAAPPSIPGVPRSVLVPHEGARFRAALDDMVGRGKRALDECYAFIDERRGRLPPNVRQPLAGVPTPAFLVAGIVVLFGSVLAVVLIVGALVGGKDKTKGPVEQPSAGGSAPAPSGSVSAPPAGDRASDSDLAGAEAGGEAALHELAIRYPKDPRIGKLLLKSELKEKNYSAVVSTIEQLLTADPTQSENPEVASALWTTAQSKETSDATFKLLEGPMGARGADLVYDLATTDGIRKDLKQRAQKWLGSEAFQHNASPALGVLVALKNAATCRQRHDLLARAKTAGDERVLALLKSYQKKSGCGRRGSEDCNECMRGDDQLAQSIAGLEDRVKK